MKKAALALAALAAIAAFFWAMGGQSLDLETLRTAIAKLRAWQADHQIAMAAAFFATYVLATALSLPVALWLTLAGGALFGFWLGLLVVSFAAAIGASLAFLTARYVLRDAVRARFAARMAALDQGIAKDGAFYLFSLRMIPIFPFFVVNLLMGLTAISLRQFYLASQLGMLAGAAVYTNAGTQLAKVQDLSQIASPAVLGSLALLGLFPWIARWVMATLQRRKALQGYARPRRFDRNLIVIGAGAAGLVSAYIAAATRAKVTLVEANLMGGDCLNTGCIPSKALLKSAKVAQQIRDAGAFGVQASAPQIRFADVMARVQSVIAAIAPHDSIERYTGLGVEVLEGRASLVDPWTVEVALKSGGVQRLTARAIILATGARPVVPPLSGLEDVGYLTSDTLWAAMAGRTDAPQRLLVLGGGPIGCELAQAFARLGSSVTQIEAAPRLMMREDPEVSAHIEAALRADGVQVLTGHKALGFGRDASGKWAEVEVAGARQRLVFDEVILALGRAPRLQGFGLEALGIATAQGLKTGAFLETSIPHIFAAGDVAGRHQFTHTAAHHAWFAAVNALFGSIKRFRLDERVIPWATFTDPEVARVGLSESEAQAQGVAYEVTRYDLGGLDRALADGTAQGFVKVLTPLGRDRILGAVIVGPHAGDVLAEFVLAMKHGLGLGKVLGTIHTYPTLSEAAKNTAGVWRRGHINAAALTLADRFHRWRRG